MLSCYLTPHYTPIRNSHTELRLHTRSLITFARDNRVLLDASVVSLRCPKTPFFPYLPTSVFIAVETLPSCEVKIW